MFYNCFVIMSNELTLPLPPSCRKQFKISMSMYLKMLFDPDLMTVYVGSKVINLFFSISKLIIFFCILSFLASPETQLKWQTSISEYIFPQ